MRSWGLVFVLATGLAIFGGPGAGQGGDRKTADKPGEVREVTDVTYFKGKEADQAKHRLDLYLPKGKKDFPVLVFVHGGAWRIGDKGNFGMYRAIGKCFARHGIGVVVPNYRLSPKYKHPAHVRDLARALAWTVKNIKQYGGRPDQIFLSGHSAGGHLVALLATDDSYLKAEGLTLKAIKGVMPISGVYQLPKQEMLAPVFGKDLAVRKNASPISHARADAPPFLLLYADDDLPTCGKAASEAFCKALRAKKCPAGLVEVKGCNHIMILIKTASDRSTGVKAMLAFIRKYTKPAKSR
jgi:acetyl esterase/lipase